MQTFTDEEIGNMSIEELRFMLKMQLERNELLVMQNKFNMYRYDCKSGVMHIMLRLPNGEIKRLSFADYFNVTPQLVFEEAEHLRVVENIKRLINDPDAPKSGAVGFTYKDGRHISCEYKIVYNEEGEISAIVGQHVDMYGTHDRLISTIHSLSEKMMYTETLTSTFETAIDFNLKNGTYKILRATPSVRAVSGQVTNINDLARIFRDFYIEKEYHDMFTEFVNLETVSERIHGRKYLSCQYKTTNIGWCEARIIPISLSSTGKVEKALFTTEIIESKREKLDTKGQVEDTDSLTGLLRMSSGESIIDESLRHRHKGLFITFECDYLHAINTMFGQPVGDLMLMEVGRALKELYPLDILTYVGNGKFVLYLTNPEVITTVEYDGQEAVFQQLNSRMNKIYIPELNGITSSVSGGFVYLKSGNLIDYKTLYEKADKLCKEAIEKGHESICHTEL